MTASKYEAKNIVITGFMGTGKTTVGRLLAVQLERPFVDMDTQIEEKFDKPIAQIFADEGEATFRATEAQLSQQMAQQHGLVISTGGGALVDPCNRQLLGESGVLICLTATADTIVRRLEEFTDRPLLPGTLDEKRARVRSLLHERRHAYAAITHHVDTTDRTPEEIVNQILAVLASDAEVSGMTRLPVRTPDGSYEICIGNGLLDHAGRLLANRGLRAGPCVVVTNTSLAGHHTQRLLASLKEYGFTPETAILEDGEEHKHLASVSFLYERFLNAGLDRRSTVIALGGGVVGDTTGFAAATYLRGVPFVQIPTSLLSMVDASVGGKTGVDLPQGKNLVGAFKQPAAVIIDTGTLASLPAVEFRSGLAEVIKHGIIGAPELFAQLETHGPTGLSQLVADAVRVKIEVVEEDPFEQGRRAVLNLGHTFGHAIELVSEFDVRHGEGVALGLVASARLSADMGKCTVALADRIEHAVDRLGLPTRLTGYSANAIMDAMVHDKKRAGKTLRFIIPRDIGDVIIVDSPGPEKVRLAVESILG